MEKWILLRTVSEGDIFKELEDIAECNADGSLKIFSSLDGASEYQELNQLDGKCVELPVYL